MKRRDFLKASGLLSIGFSSKISPSDEVDININLYQTPKISLYLGKYEERYIKDVINHSLKSLSSSRTSVNPVVNIIETSYEIEEEYDDVKNALNDWSNEYDVRNSSSNILLTDDIGSEENTGWGNYGCFICENRGIVSKASNLSNLTINEKVGLNDDYNRLYSDNMGVRELITIIHEIGHTLGFKHSDGFLRHIEDNKILVSPMVAGYYKEFIQERNLEEIENPRLFFTCEYNKSVEDLRGNLYTKL
jgi:predicted Zn-dependent protease with MMP-like domain